MKRSDSILDFVLMMGGAISVVHGQLLLPKLQRVTSASSGRNFCKARRIITGTGDRNRLAPEIAGTLFYINDNLD